MHWFVIHTKPRQERRALENLMQQGYTCYLPTLAVERIQRGELRVTIEPLFPRYLFIQLDTGGSGQSWGTIRSTKGVSRLVTFGSEPAKVDDRLIEILHSQAGPLAAAPRRLFSPGEHVIVTEGPFAGIEGIYQVSDGERRAMILIEILGKSTRLSIAPTNLQKVD